MKTPPIQKMSTLKLQLKDIRTTSNSSLFFKTLWKFSYCFISTSHEISSGFSYLTKNFSKSTTEIIKQCTELIQN